MVSLRKLPLYFVVHLKFETLTTRIMDNSNVVVMNEKETCQEMYRPNIKYINGGSS